MADVHKIEVIPKTSDSRAEQLLRLWGEQTKGKVKTVWLRDAYTITKPLDSKQAGNVAAMLTNPVTQTVEVHPDTRHGVPQEAFDWSIEIGYLPGVTDNVGHTARVSIEDLLGTPFVDQEAVYSSQIILIEAELDRAEVDDLAAGLANRLIQRIVVQSHSAWEDGEAAKIVVPQVKLKPPAPPTLIDLDVSDDELVAIGQKGIANENGNRRGPLALDLASMKAIQAYFAKLERKPTDIELESIAQTWSEHCKHTIFAGPLDEIEDGIYKTYIKAATQKVRADKGSRDLCVSVFTDNAGAIRFDDDYLVTHKVETHNSPSALDPFGGAITGIVGVNRDTMGFGMGAKPVINVYGFCLADPEDKALLYRDPKLTSAMLPPARIMSGVIAGVNAGGNQSGIPSPQGFMFFDERYKGKPLVFAGTLGIIPNKVGGKDSHEKQARPGDLIVVMGGRVGLDGIHGATFASVALDEDSPAAAVQIGDPITQKKMSDALIKEARDAGLYSSITDNGAGGLSCSVAEMAKEAGGFEVQIEKVPLKYPNLAPWQTWVSESQERMTLSVPAEHWEALNDLMKSRGVEAMVIGTFTDTGRGLVTDDGETVLDIDLEFLHDGLPKTARSSNNYHPPKVAESTLPEPSDWNQAVLKLLGSLNLASFEFLSSQYDHEVQAGSVLKPLQGRGRVNSEASVTRPVLSSPKGVVLSQGLYPSYSEMDPYAMAAASIDTAIRNVVAAGADPDTIALLDNFCWCSSNDPERLGQLKLAAQACYDYAVAFGAPFISGKDSMFNDFKGFDANGNPIQISIPPTLLVSSMGLINDASKAVSIDLKKAGDVIYLLGETADELGGSEYSRVAELSGGQVPQVDAKRNLPIYQSLARAINRDLVASSISVTRGGLAMAVVKTALAGRLGVNVSIDEIPGAASGSVARLFSESQGRIVVSVAPENQAAFEKEMGSTMGQIGSVTDDGAITITANGSVLVKVPVDDALETYRKRFKDV